jgi:hypothetical protein
MKSLSMAVVAIAAVVVSAAAHSGILPHVLYGKRLAGQVVDAETGQPIAGAYVTFIWRSGIIPSGFTGHNARDICYHAAGAITNSQGQFDVPAWRKWSTYDVYHVDPVVLVYEERHEPIQKALHSVVTYKPAEHLDERYFLKRFSGTVDQRMDMLFFGLANQSCQYGGDSQKSMFPMLKAIYEEARAISRSPSQTNALHSFAIEAAYAALAFDPNGPARDAELNAFIEEHLK